MIKLFKIFESISNIECVTKEEISFFDDVFSDLIDSGSATVVNVETLEGDINLGLDAMSKLDFLYNVYMKLRYDKEMKVHQWFVEFVGKNIILVEIEMPVANNTWNTISSLITRSVSYNTNFDFSAAFNYSIGEDGSMMRYQLFFLKNKEEIAKMGNEILMSNK